MSKQDADITHPRYADPDRTTQDLGGPPVQADLIALTGDLAGRRYTVGEKVLIGRDSEASVQLPGDDVSRRHATIWRTSANEFVVEDLKSRNGTLVNGVPVEVSVLRFGDKVQVGSKTLFVFTQHQSLEEQLVAWQRVELVSQMTAGMIHDLNNCMTVIIGNIQNLSTTHAHDAALCKCLADMEAMAWEGTNLARKVLNFARGADRARTTVDLSAMADDTLRLIRRSLPANISLELALQPDLKVTGDRSGLMQVLINLVLNARDAMPDGGRLGVMTSTGYLDDATARAARLPVSGEVVVLRVKDTGIGMSEETRKRVFEPLFTTKAQGKGTGLGLSTVARIVEGHNGGLKVESRLSHGSSFYVYLPPAASVAAADGEQPGGLEERPTLVLDTSASAEVMGHFKGFVLLLQSQPVMRQRAANIVLSLGCDVLHAGTLAETIELFERYHDRIRLLVTDVDPHATEGASAFQRLTAIEPSVKILVTATAGTPNSRQQLAKGILTFLGSPCDTKTFREALSNALAK